MANNMIINNPNQVQPFISNGQMVQADEGLRDIKGFQAIIIPDWIWYFLSVSALCVIGYVIYKYWKSRKPVEGLSLAEKTVQRLKELDISKNSKAFYIEYSEIVRIYLEERLGLHVLDKTAEELKPLLISEHRILTTQAVILAKIFARADLAKFAKQNFSEEVKAKDLEASVGIIKNIENNLQIEEQKKLEEEKRGLGAVR